jgi:hypothetical protein
MSARQKKASVQSGLQEKYSTDEDTVAGETFVDTLVKQHQKDLDLLYMFSFWLLWCVLLAIALKSSVHERILGPLRYYWPIDEQPMEG